MDRKILDHLRSSTIGPKKIKVVYLGKLGGFYYGKVIEAKARYVKNSCRAYPHPKWERCEYEIEDEDGDSYAVSEYHELS